MRKDKKQSYWNVALLICLVLPAAPAHAVSKAALGEWKPALVDGNPALQYVADGWSTYIEITKYKGTLAFKMQSVRFKGGEGFLYISANNVAWDPAFATSHGDNGFDFPLRDVNTASSRVRRDQWRGGTSPCSLNASGTQSLFYPLLRKDTRTQTLAAETTYAHWCTTSIMDFRAALDQFKDAVGSAVWDASSIGKDQRETIARQVAAWRTAGSKVDPPEEAQRHFVLAQEAFNEKDSNRQAQELSAALEIYPTWPDRQYDLALLLGELGRYSEAIEHMQMYLELSPNAPDAQKVKQQIWIWQDKVERASPATADADADKLGITVTANAAPGFGSNGGVSVTSVRVGSFAEEIGLPKGAVITQINRKAVNSEADYKSIVDKLRSGEDVVLAIHSPGINGGHGSYVYVVGTLSAATPPTDSNKK